MKPDTDSAAFDLLRQIIKENPNASKEELLRLFQKNAANDEEVKKAVFHFFLKNAIAHRHR
jgi:hypothetical protein